MNTSKSKNNNGRDEKLVTSYTPPHLDLQQSKSESMEEITVIERTFTLSDAIVILIHETLFGVCLFYSLFTISPRYFFYYLGIIVVINLILFFNIPDRLLSSFNTVKITEEGIWIASKYIKWEYIGEIRAGSKYLKKYPSLTLIPDKEKVPFWTLKPQSYRITVRGPLFYAAAEKIISRIKKHRPDLTIPHLPSLTPNFPWKKHLIALAGIITIASLTGALFSINASFPILQLQYSNIGIYFSFMIIGFSVIFETDIRDEHTDFSRLNIFCSTFIVYPSILFFLINPNEWIFRLLLYSEILFIAIAIFTLYFFKLSTIMRKLAIFAIFITVPPLIAALTYKSPPKTTELTDFFGNEMPGLLKWSRDGRYLIQSSCSKSENVFLIDIENRKKIPLPYHKGCRRINLLYSHYVVITEQQCKGPDSLFIYDINTGKETELDKGRKICVSTVLPLSQGNEKLLAWLSVNKDNYQIKTVNLETAFDSSPTTLKISIPENYKWQGVSWIRENELIIYGGTESKEKCSTGHFITMKYDLERQKQSEVTVSEHNADRWYPLLNFRYAFTVTKLKSVDKEKLCYVNLSTGETLDLKGKYLPSWITDNKYAFRTLTKNRQTLFCKFDIQTGKEKAICELKTSKILLGVSHDGRYALFATSGFLSLSRYQLLDLKMMKWQNISFPGYSFSNDDRSSLVLSNSSYSIWTPKQNYAVIESFNPFIKHSEIRLLDLNK